MLKQLALAVEVEVVVVLQQEVWLTILALPSTSSDEAFFSGRSRSRMCGVVPSLKV